MPMGHWYALRGAFLQQWRETADGRQFLLVLIGQIPLVAMIGWIAHSSENAAVVATVAIGALFMVVWNQSVFRIGFSLTGELMAGTLELNLLARSPLVLIMFGKALAQIAFLALTGAVALAVALMVVSDPVVIARWPMFLVSFAVAIVAAVALQFLFAPLTFLVRGSPGFFNAILPLGVVLSGFVAPVTVLPLALEIPARALPTSWAMEALVRSIDGTGSGWRIAAGWAAALALATVFGFLEWRLFDVAERRARLRGGLMAGG